MYKETKNAIKLTKPSDWWVWSACIRNFAAIQSIWVYVDPDGTTPEPADPIPPEPSVLDGETVTEMCQSDEMDISWMHYHSRERKVNQCREWLLELRAVIDESIPRMYQRRLGPEYSIREAIRLLRAEFKPSYQERVMELNQRLQYLSTPNRETLSEKWFLEWQDLAVEAEDCPGYPEKGLCLLSRFCDAAEVLVPILTERQRLVIMIKEMKEEEINICRQILCFQSQYALYKAETSHDGACDTFQGRPQGNRTPNSNIGKARNSQPRHRMNKRNDCFCGQFHRFRQCPYVNPAVQPVGWVPDPAVQARFNGPMHPAVQGVLNRVREGIVTNANRNTLQQPASPQPETHIVAFYTSRSSSKPPSDYELRDSWILSDLSNRHACNDLSRFQMLYPAQDENVMIFGASTPIMGYGTVIVNADGCNGQRVTLELKDTAYMPGMHTNIVSLQRAKQAGIYFNSRLDRLEERDGRPLCHIYSHYSQFVVEYNPREDTHTNTAAVDQLTAATEGVSLSSGADTEPMP